MRNPGTPVGGDDVEFPQYLGTWPPVDLRRRTTVSSSVAERWRQPATSARRKGCRTPRLRSGLVGSPATIKAYFYDPTGEKARAVKARYVGVCRGCGAYTQARNGKGDAYAFCKACHPGAIERRWTRACVLSAMRAWQNRYGHLPSSYDWSVTHACRRGGVARERLIAGTWPSASVVTALFGRWAAARDAARRLLEEERPA